jgi:hypothetical protein
VRTHGRLIVLEQNTQLTRVTQELSARLEVLTAEIHRSVLRS